MSKIIIIDSHTKQIRVGSSNEMMTNGGNEANGADDGRILFSRVVSSKKVVFQRKS